MVSFRVCHFWLGFFQAAVLKKVYVCSKQNPFIHMSFLGLFYLHSSLPTWDFIHSLQVNPAIRPVNGSGLLGLGRVQPNPLSQPCNLILFFLCEIIMELQVKYILRFLVAYPPSHNY
ncbi:uncharacterized protein LOC126628053 isoform X1 [Malus sylvestris]|uniref:uncharacterized protein LOC126628053 isoform X1 n=1 Tax=Malus sylvestris TaxID=3752 RepID=UPI0021AC433D|nr:uncharacterized protein LOC126628053 isoform X1 [Malus sylvestris]